MDANPRESRFSAVSRIVAGTAALLAGALAARVLIFMTGLVGLSLLLSSEIEQGPGDTADTSWGLPFLISGVSLAFAWWLIRLGVALLDRRPWAARAGILTLAPTGALIVLLAH